MWNSECLLPALLVPLTGWPSGGKAGQQKPRKTPSPSGGGKVFSRFAFSMDSGSVNRSFAAVGVPFVNHELERLHVSGLVELNGTDGRLKGACT